MQVTARVVQIIGGIVSAAALLTTGAAVVTAAPAVAEIDTVSQVGPQRHDLVVSSPAMGGDVRVTVLTPAQASGTRGTLYLLDGAGAGNADHSSDWLTKGGAAEFFDDKDVNVVLPTGEGAFYTNWQNRDAVFGKPQWETFLTDELPPLIDAEFNGNGNNAIAGLSMGGQAAYALASRHPDLYSGAGSLSGCPPVTGAANEAYVRATVAKDGGDATNMWGPFGASGWTAHDPSHRLDVLRGKHLFISAGSGIPGPLDQTTQLEDGKSREEMIAAGMTLESGAYRCSVEFALLMRANGVRATESFHAIGTHAWPYWKQDLEKMWPVLERGL